MFKKIILLCATIFIIGPILNISAKTKFGKYTKIECNGSPEWFKNVVCQINEISKYNNSADLSSTIIKPIETMEMHVKLYKLPDVESPFIINYEFNGCKVLSGDTNHPFLDMFGDIIKKQTNLLHPCPFKDDIYARGLDIYEFPLWASAPLGNYRLDFEVFEDKHVSIGTMKFFAEIGEY